MSRAKERRISIPSDTAEGAVVQEEIISALEENGFSDRDVFGARLALEEAIVNAIKHGNGLDPDKQVHIHWKVDESQMRVEVTDEGPGFQVEDVPDPTDDENLERPCGRGIMLMKAFMTKVEYSPSGNSVVLEKVRSEVAAQ
jgi:serine/threonine-protein kinase RsbW